MQLSTQAHSKSDAGNEEVDFLEPTICICYDDEDDYPVGVEECDASYCMEQTIEDWAKHEKFDSEICICDNDESSTSKSSRKSSSTKKGETKYDLVCESNCSVR